MTVFRSWWRSRGVTGGADALIVVAVLVLSYQLAWRYVTRADVPTLIDWELKPAIMYGCGYGFVQPSVPSPEALRFLARKSGSIACRDFAWGGAPGPALSIAQANKYSLYGAGLAMRWYGVSWDTLDSYLAVLYALSMAFTYGLFRMAAGPLLSAAFVALFACSYVIGDIVVLRDFVKLPCFTALWLVLAWLVRAGFARGSRAAIAPMAVAGALLGVGIGLRMDALVFLPIFVAVTLIVIPGFSLRQLAVKAAASAAFLLLFFVTGRPILTSVASGSNSAHVVVLGLTTPFNGPLSVEPAPYDVGSQYSDGYAYNVIISDAMLAQGVPLPILLGTAHYDQVGNRFLRRLAHQFPADVITRAVGATLQVFRFQADWRILDQTSKMPALRESGASRRVTEWRTWVMGWFEGRELGFTALVLVLAGAFNWRLGALGLALILYFCGYSMLQFSRRHAFHLDVIPLFVILLAVQLPITLAWRVGKAWRENEMAARDEIRRMARTGAVGAVVLAGAAAAFGVVWAGARWYQQRTVTGIIDHTLAATWEGVATTDEPLASTILVDGNPIPPWYEIFHRNREAWRDGTMVRVPGAVAAGAEAQQPDGVKHQYFRVTIDNRCGAVEVLITPSYSAAVQTLDSIYTRSFTIPTGTSPSRLLLPAYYHLGSTWNRLDGFGVAAGQRSCITAIDRVASVSLLPEPVLFFALAPDWRTAPLYQRLLDRPRVTMSGTPVDPLPDAAETHRSGWRRNAAAPLGRAAPPIDAWQAMDGVTINRAGDAFHIAGNRVPSGYQLMSPPLDVAADSTVAVQIVGSIDEGEMCIGILDGAQQSWLLAPSDARSGLLARTGPHAQVRIVFSNCANPPGAFTVRQVTYETVQSK